MPRLKNRSGAWRWLLVPICACLATVTFAGTATAGTYGPYDCVVDNGGQCITGETHTYDDNGAYAPNAPSAYIFSALRNPSTGTWINVKYAYGTAYQYYRNNTDVFLKGHWGNVSGYRLLVRGTFHY